MTGCGLKTDKKNLKRNRLALFALMPAVFLCFSFSSGVHAENAAYPNDIIKRQAGSPEIKEIENQLKKYSENDIDKIMKDYDPKKIVGEAAKGKFSLNLPEMLANGIQYMLGELYRNMHILIKLLLIAVMCAVLKNLKDSFLSENVGELAFYVCYIVMISIIALSFKSAITIGTGIIDKMVGFMYATVPVLITLLVSGGNITSGGVFQPLLIMVVEVLAGIFKNVFIPLVFLSAVLSMAGNISEKVRISKLAGLLKQIAGWGIGIILTVFIAAVSIQGSMGAVADGVIGKTAKFAIGTFVPIAGSYLADAADTVIGCSLLIKNAAGIAALVGIAAICLIPLLKLAAIIILYRLAAALVEPISEKRISDCINDIAGSLSYILGIAASVAFMFFISVTAIIGASNLSAMIR